jgi:hypothetical protein
MRKFRQQNEGFDWIFEALTVEEQVTRLKQWKTTNQALVPIVRMGVGADKPNWNLPEGMPDNIKLDMAPEGLGATSIMMEWRRISQFVDPNSNMNNLVAWKREMNWAQILEGIHPSEAAILTHVKDGTLLELYPKLEKLLAAIGITDYTKPKKKRASKKKVVSKKTDRPTNQVFSK